jgi:hypothetical protein
MGPVRLVPPVELAPKASTRALIIIIAPIVLLEAWWRSPSWAHWNR